MSGSSKLAIPRDSHLRDIRMFRLCSDHVLCVSGATLLLMPILIGQEWLSKASQRGGS
jgi:hypothetical protein